MVQFVWDELPTEILEPLKECAGEILLHAQKKLLHDRVDVDYKAYVTFSIGETGSIRQLRLSYLLSRFGKDADATFLYVDFTRRRVVITGTTYSFPLPDEFEWVFDDVEAWVKDNCHPGIDDDTTPKLPSYGCMGASASQPIDLTLPALDERPLCIAMKGGQEECSRCSLCGDCACQGNLEPNSQDTICAVCQEVGKLFSEHGLGTYEGVVLTVTPTSPGTESSSESDPDLTSSLDDSDLSLSRQPSRSSNLPKDELEEEFSCLWLHIEALLEVDQSPAK